MVKRVFSLFLCAMMLSVASLALAGGAPAVGAAPCAPGYPAYPAKAYVPAGNPCAYWGDAPFPGVCGGIVALPFLVVGSLLGGNTVGPYPPVPGPGYRGVPAPYPPAKVYVPPAAPVCAPAYAPPACGPTAYGGGGGMFSGIPCLELCSSLLGMGGGSGLFY